MVLAQRRELRRWMDRRPAGPRLEWEGLLKVSFGDLGSREYEETGGPFPERLGVIGLSGKILLEWTELVARWAAWAEDAVETWDDDGPPPTSAQGRLPPWLAPPGMSAVCVGGDGGPSSRGLGMVRVRGFAVAGFGRGRRWSGFLGLLAAIAVVVGGCGDDDDHDDSGAAVEGEADEEQEANGEQGCGIDGATSEPAEASVEVALTEYAMEPVPAEVPAGPIELVADNEGLIWHEVIVVRFDGDSGTIPLNVVGGADLRQLPEDAVVGRMRNFMAGETCRATFDLAPGRYALVCNLVDDGANPHYSQGMHAGLTVT